MPGNAYPGKPGGLRRGKEPPYVLLLHNQALGQWGLGRSEMTPLALAGGHHAERRMEGRS
jgi:hypothetical protein